MISLASSLAKTALMRVLRPLDAAVAAILNVSPFVIYFFSATVALVVGMSSVLNAETTLVALPSFCGTVF